MIIKEQQLRRIIRKLITELNKQFDLDEKDLPDEWIDKMKTNNWKWKRGVGFLGKPRKTGKFDEEGRPVYERNPIKSVDEYSASTIGLEHARQGQPDIYGNMSAINWMGAKRDAGRAYKKTFAAMYKKNKAFFDKFVYVHWTDDLEHSLKGSNKNELSCMFYDHPPFIAGKAPVGIILEGYLTGMANVNMFTGYSKPELNFKDKDFMDNISYMASPHRRKSSGQNKYPTDPRALNLDAQEFGSKAGLIFKPSDVDTLSIDRVRRGGTKWGDQTMVPLNNEALLDNWKAVKILVTKHATPKRRKHVAEVAKRYNLDVIDEDGNILQDAEAIERSPKRIADELAAISKWDAKSDSKKKPPPPPPTPAEDENRILDDDRYADDYYEPVDDYDYSEYDFDD